MQNKAINATNYQIKTKTKIKNCKFSDGVQKMNKNV